MNYCSAFLLDLNKLDQFLATSILETIELTVVIRWGQFEYRLCSNVVVVIQIFKCLSGSGLEIAVE